jgi:hypothetical protein
LSWFGRSTDILLAEQFIVKRFLVRPASELRRFVSSNRAMTAWLELTRQQILAYRRRVGALDEKLPMSPDSLRRAAWAGLQDSMPRAALFSIHARVEGTGPSAWEDPSLVQTWGPRFNAYVVPKADMPVFTLGRMPDDGPGRERAEDMARRLEAVLDGEPRESGPVGKALGVHPSALRYAAPTGRFAIRWDGARRPTVWMLPPPEIEPAEARRELARRYLHVLGPGTPDSFAQWAGIRDERAEATFQSLRRSLAPVRTPIGEAWILRRDEEEYRHGDGPVAPARLLPSGDAYYLFQGDARRLLVPDETHRGMLWTSRVWPGAVLVEGEIVGIWRRSQHRVTIETWRRLGRSAREAVETEALSLPVPGIDRDVIVSWDD